MKRLIRSIVIFTFVMVAGLTLGTAEVRAEEDGAYFDGYAVHIQGDGRSNDELTAANDAYYAELASQYEAEEKASQSTSSSSSSSSATNQKTSSAPKYTDAEIEAAWVESSRTEATCAKDGVITYKNSLTGKTKTEAIPATGKHTYELTEHVDSTCINNGYDAYTCTVCGNSYATPIEELGAHSYKVTAKTDATCETDCSVSYTCDLCGESYTETVAATGHTEGKAVVTKKAGMFSEGTQTISCSKCGELLSTEVIPQTFPIPFAGLIALAIGSVILAGVIIFVKKR